MITEGHTIMVNCDVEGCTNADTYAYPNSSDCVRELRRDGWEVNRNIKSAICASCVQKHKDERAAEQRLCVECGKLYHPIKSNQKFCHVRCKFKSDDRKANEKRKAKRGVFTVLEEVEAK